MVTGFVTQGRPGNGQYVETYIVQYSTNGTLWQMIKDTNGETKTFTGNIDVISLSESILSNPITASYIRVTPTTWKYAPGLRLEIMGCPIHQLGLRQTCWKAYYVIEAPRSDMFSATSLNLGECGKECHNQNRCRAFTFNQRSSLCQGYNHTIFLNTTLTNGTMPNLDNLFPLFVKQNDCL
ncbi:lactadherin-like [Pecten maximus]|uniref:lactadherin-like n=1 Tax=Pecten maximus TaxID=6579 RepID=UPI001458199A|nr:lactadherin-like [Pecten maximus]